MAKETFVTKDFLTPSNEPSAGVSTMKTTMTIEIYALMLANRAIDFALKCNQSTTNALRQAILEMQAALREDAGNELMEAEAQAYASYFEAQEDEVEAEETCGECGNPLKNETNEPYNPALSTCSYCGQQYEYVEKEITGYELDCLVASGKAEIQFLSL